jgi:hypothetical protein
VFISVEQACSTMQNSRSSEEELAGMQVIVRVRPPTEAEMQSGLAVEVICFAYSEVVLLDLPNTPWQLTRSLNIYSRQVDSAGTVITLRSQRTGKGMESAFDKVLSSSASQHDVYNCVAPSIKRVSTLMIALLNCSAFLVFSVHTCCISCAEREHVLYRLMCCLK